MYTVKKAGSKNCQVPNNSDVSFGFLVSKLNISEISAFCDTAITFNSDHNSGLLSLNAIFNFDHNSGLISLNAIF